jgi:hypothetical protein
MAQCGATLAMRCAMAGAIADRAAGPGPWATWGQIMGQMALRVLRMKTLSSKLRSSSSDQCWRRA